LVNEDKLDKPEAGEVLNEIEKDSNITESDKEKENTISSIEICNKENEQMTPMTDEECEIFKKLLAPLHHSVKKLEAIVDATTTVAAGIHKPPHVIQDNNIKMTERQKLGTRKFFLSFLTLTNVF